MTQRVRPVLPALRPGDFLGSYQVAAPFQTAAGPTALSPYFSLRWAPTSGQMFVLTKAALVLLKVSADGSGVPTVGLFAARNFTAADSGGTAISFTGNAQKKRTSYPSSLVADARVGAGAALTSGTRVLDGQPILAQVANPTGGGSYEAAQGFVQDLSSDPIVLVSGEGLELINVNAVTTAAFRGVLTLEWSEFAQGATI